MNERAQDLRAKLEAEYERLAERARKIYENGHEKGREAMERAMETARRQMTAAGAFTAEQGAALKERLSRDMERVSQEMHRLGDEAQQRLQPERLKSGALSSWARILQSAGERLQGMSQRAEQALECEVGQVTGPCTLTCLACGHRTTVTQTCHIAPCAECRGALFRKGY